MSSEKMVTPNNQLVELHRLAALLLQVVNIAEGCVEKLQKGFVEPIDIIDTQKTIKQLQINILQIDCEADDILNGNQKSTNPEG